MVLILFSILAYTQTGDMPSQSAMFPRIVLYGIGITGLLMIVDTLIKVKRGKATNDSSLTLNSFIFQILIPGAFLLITYQLLTIFGFYISAFFLIMVVFFYQTYRANNIKITGKHFLKGLIVAVLITAIMYIIFTLLLGLPVPSGSFFR
ncbi:tripartite tricarboxylate transporter TctB family protein [Anaerobacillus arseniciselenatis]|uniref:tripartite tricarboxylate transporter TctB family protein n=1 Tax=Anaerobacillus arseniciselenatis TaxID=85682 RepID=UPI00147190D2|nr:tripartite tricarboxylate transporter TctB family protein [Anaerobacillus arseniciselenatis]